MDALEINEAIEDNETRLTKARFQLKYCNCKDAMGAWIEYLEEKAETLKGDLAAIKPVDGFTW